MLVTLSGIVTLTVLVEVRNAPNPMVATGSPSMLLGMVTAPPRVFWFEALI